MVPFIFKKCKGREKSKIKGREGIRIWEGNGRLDPVNDKRLFGTRGWRYRN